MLNPLVLNPSIATAAAIINIPKNLKSDFSVEYPALSISSLTFFTFTFSSSYSMSRYCSVKLAFAFSTPSVFKAAFSTLASQEEQVISYTLIFSFFIPIIHLLNFF
ncbi:hypothetical protein SDC9_82620 [bioreactor metagenome]|uniref:Uncharacterized protein n=1 Tax=bioreactor metagenome TaxID=1076179 RepID=A0A644Z534_9ZZZZ